MIKAEAVKARLKNLSLSEGDTMQNKLTIYALERAIYRMSISEYSARFTLKGGIFLYALFDRQYARATTDIDLLAECIPNDAEKMKEVFCDIFSIECDDALRFDLDSLQVKHITEFKEYHGVNVFIYAYLDRTRIPISIDLGFGDVIYPDRAKMDFPVLLDMEEPKVYAYSVYSVIAEKFEAITSLGLANGRYKDFYDIYILSKHFEFDGDKLGEAIVETFMHRGTEFDDIAAFEDGFTLDPVRQKRWAAFVKKKKALEKVHFTEVMNRIKLFLIPVVDGIQNDLKFDLRWSSERGEWL